MPSLSFDPFAQIYDATRGYPEVVAQQIAQAIDQAADATARTAYLEVGVGTGRIALPIASSGHTYTGVDISEKMVEQFEEKLRREGWQEVQQPWGTLPDESATLSPVAHRYRLAEKQAAVRLVMSDITALPFRDDSFDAVVSVHVFHLVDGWQRAVEESLRVLRPGGVLLYCGDDHEDMDVREQIAGEWRRIIKELGGDNRRPGASSPHMVTDYLQQQGFTTERLCAVTWESKMTARQVLEGFERRYFSHVWVIAEDIFAVAINRLRSWVEKHYEGRMDTTYIHKHRFMINKTQV